MKGYHRAMFDWFVWTPVTQFMLLKLVALAVLAGYIGWRSVGYVRHRQDLSTPRTRRQGYTEAELIDK